MYAIVDIAGQQVKVEKGQQILVHRLEGEKGSKVDFDQVLLISDNEQTAIGDPVIDGAQVQAVILDHVKGDKVFVFKKKRRKGFKKFNGHRQYLSLLEIEEIIEKGAKPKKETKKAEKKVEKKEVEEMPAEKAPKAEATESKVKEKPAKEETKTAKPRKKSAASKAEASVKEEKPKKAPRKKKDAESETSEEG